MKLYIDFDGVILNTIDITYNIYKKNKNKFVDMQDFYKCLDWNELLKISSPINDSLNSIKKIIDSNLYDVYILSHVVTNNEAKYKKIFLEKNIPGIKLITVPREIEKCDVVDAKNAILVDDYMGNLELWEAKGGIPIKFSDKGKSYNIMSIDRLDMLLDDYDNIKKLIKHR